MEIQQFISYAEESAKLYYDYLNRKGLGVIKTSVKKIEYSEPYFYLHLTSKLHNTDDLEFDFHGLRHSGFQVRPIEYDKDKNVLTVRVQPTLEAEFLSLSPTDLTLIADLKFLVKRVGEWYAHMVPTLSIPLSCDSVSFASVKLRHSLSSEQADAVSGALSSPFSYIWGAPGTGKTQMVLATCVAALLHTNKKVLLLAPTNNALEQMLTGVFPVLKDNGVSSDKVLRLGTPSAQFLAEYPESCEYLNVDKQVQILNARLDTLTRFQNYRSFLQQWEVVLPMLYAVIDLMDDISEILLELYPIDLELSQYKAEIVHLQYKSKIALSEFQTTQSYVENASFFERKIHSKKFQESINRLATLSEEIHSCSSKLDSSKKRAESASRKFIFLSQKIDERKEILETACFLLRDYTSFYSPLSKLFAPYARVALYDSLKISIENINSMLSRKAKFYSSYSDMSDEDLSAEILSLKYDIEKQSSRTTDSRSKNACVLAATIDRFFTISFPQYAEDGFFPDHIFLDEAGYCSLIKGIAPLSLHVPYTLLGDHMQLPPVCEMDDGYFRSEDFRSVCLWAQSAIHCDEPFYLSMYDICDLYLSGKDACFQHIKRYSLSHTFRFGNNLSKILADFVYTSDFCSNLQYDTQIYFLPAPASGENRQRVSLSECEAIKHFIHSNHDPDFCILTPYRDQLSALSKLFPALRRDNRILTVHASQGREWGTVLLSVVDTNRMWFTNSDNHESKGKQVINTAISRAKDKMILVCDIDYWSQHPEQLIGRLVLSAEPYSFFSSSCQ